MLTLHTRIWTAATGDDLGLTTSRIKAAEGTGKIADTSDLDDVVEFHKPHDLPLIADACETLVNYLKTGSGSVWLKATKIWISMMPSWNKAWKTKESAMIQLIETSRQRFASAGGGDRDATCALDEIFKREAQAELKGKHSSHREMIDETFAYIIGK